jgi:hypothetical protein
MITFTLVAVLGILLAIVIKQLFRKEPTKVGVLQPPADLGNLKITDARTGEKRWVELGGMYRGRRVYIETVDEDELEVSAVLHPNKLTIEDLGLNEQDLADIDERQNTADHFEFDGKVWFYRFSKEIVLVRDGQPNGTGYYLWEFREDGGKQLVNVRKGEGEPFTASLSTVVNAGDITVYREN